MEDTIMLKSEELARLDAFIADMPHGYVRDSLEALRPEIVNAMANDMPLMSGLEDTRRRTSGLAHEARERAEAANARAVYLEAEAVRLEDRISGARRTLRGACEAAREAASEYHAARRAIETLRNTFALR